MSLCAHMSFRYRVHAGAPRGQEKMLGVLELELQTMVRLLTWVVFCHTLLDAMD